MFRHSFAIRLITSGMDIFNTQELPGHNDANTTMLYLHVIGIQERVVVSLPTDPWLRFRKISASPIWSNFTQPLPRPAYSSHDPIVDSAVTRNWRFALAPPRLIPHNCRPMKRIPTDGPLYVV
ncbi:tyrosine-type recombinase/integrase [Microbulbifer guangxiensis]|uniref:tyrosine-type recombinase/integrase n=1 Tax=Microbulbifer guangxiensis TaxID=2904249 RepID=UPI0034E19632